MHFSQSITKENNWATLMKCSDKEGKLCCGAQIECKRQHERISKTRGKHLLATLPKGWVAKDLAT